MVLGVGIAPMVVGCKRQYADELANNFIGAFGREERAMAAVMLQREKTRKQCAERECKQKCERIVQRLQPEHESDEGKKNEPR